MSPADGSPSESSDAEPVTRFAAALRHRVLGGRIRHVKALVADADAIGVGRSTIYSALSGHRLPSEYTLRRLLVVAARAEEEEIQRWIAARAELDKALQNESGADSTTPVDGIGPGPESSSPVPPTNSAPAREPTSGPERPPSVCRTGENRDSGLLRWRGRAGWGLGGAVCGAVLVVGLQLLLPAAGGPAGRDASTGNGCSPVPDDRARAVTATVVGTEGQGVYTHLVPGGECRSGFLPERSGIDVVCLVLDGPDVVTTRNGGLRRWPVWDRLSSGAYVSDLYTDLPKSTSPALVAGLPRC